MSRLVPFNRKDKLDPRPRGMEDFYHMLDDFFSDAWPLTRNLAHDTFKMDVQETESEYYIEAEMPGVDKDDIKLDMADGRLRIAVQREEDIEEENENFIHRERRKSSMQRSIQLPDATSEGIKARLDKGILKIAVPKEEQAAETIEIDIE